MSDPTSRDRRALRLDVWIPVAYAVVSVAWIALSDLLLATAARSPGERTEWSILKGLGFVAVTAILLHAGLRWALARERSANLLVEASAAALRTSEEKLRLAFDAARIGMWDRHIPSGVLFCSDGCRAIFGVGPETAMTYELFLRAIHPEDRGRIAQAVEEALARRTDYEAEMRVPWPDGTVHWVAAKGRGLYDPAGRAVRFVGTVLDITERKRAEEVLKESEERYRSIFESSADAIVAIDREGHFTEANPAALRMLGYSREELLQLSYQQITPARWHAMNDVMLRDVPTRGYSAEYEKEYVRKDGTAIPISVRAFQQRDFAGRPVGAWAIVREMAERKLAEEALRESEERFRVAFQTSPDSININRLDDGLYVAVNEGFTRMTGWTEAEVLGRSSLELHIWDDPADRARLVAGLKKDRYVENLEARFRRKDGSVLSGLMSARLIGLRGEQYLLSITRDVSEWKRAEEERGRLKSGLYQAAKMEAIGQLAGGVAHDFNNLLTVILAGAEALKHDLAEGSAPDPEIVEEIGASGARARDLTRQLLAFARRQVIAPVPLDLNALLRAAERLLRRVLGEDIVLATTLQPDLWTVRCDPGQIDQVILNLAVNARDAMPRGGELTIETANVVIDERFAASRPWMRPGPYARLSMRDSGHGMSPDVKAHIFEPFFTTKPVGQGTGLGLATVYGIVKQNEGYILAESESGQGTAFQLFFPRSSEAAVPVEPPAALGATHGTETVLVVEDDPQVREVTVRSLRAGGYAVRAASGGREALDLAAREQGPLHLLVTDVVMPGLDGRAVADALRHQHPALRVLYVSGYAEEAIVKRGVLEPGIELLPKPFTAAALLARVRAVLDAR